jgi:hypothetical protein
VVTDHLNAWRELVASDDLTAGFRRHLAFLVDSPESEMWLSDLLGGLVTARIENDTLELVFQYAEYDDETCVVTFGPPYAGDTGDAPASVGEVARVHNGIGWESLGGGGFGFIGFDGGCFVGGGGWEAEALTEAADENRAFLDQLAEAGLTVDDVVSLSDYGQNWLLWHPVEKNVHGEPTVYFVSHGDCVATPVSRARDLPFGPLMLAMMVQEIRGRDVLDGVYN